MKQLNYKGKIFLLDPDKKCLAELSNALNKQTWDVHNYDSLEKALQDKEIIQADIFFIGGDLKVNGETLESKLQSEDKFLPRLISKLNDLSPHAIHVLTPWAPIQEIDNLDRKKYRDISYDLEASCNEEKIIRVIILRKPYDRDEVYQVVTQNTPKWVKSAYTSIEWDLIVGLRKLSATVKLVDEIEGLEPHKYLDMFGPSRHIVGRSTSSNTIIKVYMGQEGKDLERWQNELSNLQKFSEINRTISGLYQEIGGTDLYIGLAEFNKTRLALKNITLFDTISGELLYSKIHDNEATFKDFLLAAIQIARIQELGESHKDEFALIDVVEDRKKGAPETIYFSESLSEVLAKLRTYADFSISSRDERDIVALWDSVISRKLVEAQKTFGRFYYDGSPTNFIYDEKTGQYKNIDIEDKRRAPCLLGLASLLSFGLTKQGQPYLSENEQIQILDRYLLEGILTTALVKKDIEQARRIFKYITKINESYHYDLLGSNKFFWFVGNGDINRGKKIREEFQEIWPFALVYSNLRWVGHKTQFREIAEYLVRADVTFILPDPVQRNRLEQKEHLRVALDRLQQLVEEKKVDTDAGKKLHYYIEGIANNPYFQSPIRQY